MIIAIPTNNTALDTDTPQRSQNAAYCEYVKDAGFTPILVPMEAEAEEIAEITDGLLLAGGIDVDPIYYGESNNACFNVDPEKDQHERNLLHAFREYKKPVFGICRGHQLICHEFLHTHREEYDAYIGHLDNITRHTQTEDLDIRRNIPTHYVRANISSLFSDANGPEFGIIPVNSIHHQAFSVNHVQVALDFGGDDITLTNVGKYESLVTIIDDFELIAWSSHGVYQPKLSNGTPDSPSNWAVIEAMRIHNWGSPIMGVQWHPEELKDVKILRNFFLKVTSETDYTINAGYNHG